MAVPPGTAKNHSPDGALTSRIAPQIGLEFVGERLLKFFKFRPNDRRAVGLSGIIHKVVLMILFRRIERGERLNLGDDGRVERPRCVEFPLVMLGKLLLLRVVVENDRAVLRPEVVALAIPSGRVVRLPED